MGERGNILQKSTKWDLFISHASEDKETFVRPLAEELLKYGIDLWYDEFSLELGDSLTHSIDKGLLESKYGLVVISPAFFTKNWTDYELKSLLTKEINGVKTILPIWHNVDQKLVSSKSLYLADKKALSSEIGIKKLAFEIIKVIRPDILSSNLMIKAYRELPCGNIEKIALSDLHMIEGVRHESLPMGIIIASKLIDTIFPFQSYQKTLENFAKDVDYYHEFAIWITMSCAYIDTIREFGFSMSDKKTNYDIFYCLLYFSLNYDSGFNNVELQDNVKTFIIQSYEKHAKVLFPLIEKK